MRLSDRDLLAMVHDRLINKHGESPNSYFMARLWGMANAPVGYAISMIHSSSQRGADWVGFADFVWSFATFLLTKAEIKTDNQYYCKADIPRLETLLKELVSELPQGATSALTSSEAIKEAALCAMIAVSVQRISYLRNLSCEYLVPTFTYEVFSMFATEVTRHIDQYTVPQYGDKGEDQVTNYSDTTLRDAIRKYPNRLGRNSRPGQEMLDLVKTAHYCQLLTSKILDETPDPDIHFGLSSLTDYAKNLSDIVFPDSIVNTVEP